jgi:CheY-like chemotaxis protein
MSERPLRVLVVEDEVLVAAELSILVEEAGHVVVGEAIDSVEALAIATEFEPELALVDVHLQDGPTGVSLARRLAETGVMVLFMTANQKRLPEDFAGAAGLVAKPYTNHGVQEAVTWLAGCLRAGRCDRPPPHSLTVAPGFMQRWAPRSAQPASSPPVLASAY